MIGQQSIEFIRRSIGPLGRTIDNGPISGDEKIRLQHYTVFLALGIPTMLGYGFYNILKANYLLCFFIIMSALGLSVGWLYLRKAKDGKTIYRINIFLFSLLVLYMVIKCGPNGSKILWTYTFPLIAFFLFGKGEGLFWSAYVFLAALFLAWNPAGITVEYNYPNEFVVRFLITYAIVSAISYWFEFFRYRYRVDVELKNELLQQEIKERKQSQQEKENLIEELQQALDEVKTLSGLLPICSSCKKIRDDKGYWKRNEGYIQDHSEATFSHGICPECMVRLYPDVDMNE